jgi:hypothetical protein
MSSAPAGALSLAQIGFKAFGDVEKGMGTQAADEYQAVWLERAAEYGRLLAKQAGAQMTERLVATLDHIDAVQSARHVDLTSPSAVAVREHEEFVGERAKTIEGDKLLAQSQQDEADAAYLRQAGSFALLIGKVSAGADIAGGLAEAFKPSGSLAPTGT